MAAYIAQRRRKEEDLLAIVRAAVDFKNRWGRRPTLSNGAEFFHKLKGSISEDLTEVEIISRFRYTKHMLHNRSIKPPLALSRLLAELWQGTSDKKKTKHVVEEPREDAELGIDCLPYVKEAVSEYWKENGLSSVALEEGLKLVDVAQAAVLEKKWKSHMSGEIRLLLDWSKTRHEILVMLHEANEDAKI